MILNAYAVLDVFLAFLRLGTGVSVVLLGGWTLMARRTAATPEVRKALEDRCYLLFLLALLLLALNVASWPLLYLMLESYVPQWPGVMCIYGVTRIGTGSLGTAAYLPGLLTTLQALKPALVFITGAWFVLYRLNRRTRMGALVGRVVGVLVLLGLVAVADASVDLAYVAIPKQEEFLSIGCCSVANPGPSSARLEPRALVADSSRPPLSVAYYAVHLALALTLWPTTRPWRSPLSLGWLGPLLLLAVISWPVAWVFLIEIAAPALLHLPYHHCAYDLIGRVPESMLAVAMFIGGSFCIGWGGVAAWLADTTETRPFLQEEVQTLLYLGLLGYAGSLTMMSVELALA